MISQCVRHTASRILVTALVAIASIGIAATPASARSITWRSITMPGGGDTFDNYDYHSRSRSASNVDWPVNLIFWNNATVPKVKAPIAAAFPHTGSVQSAWVAGSWDDDRGRKQYPGQCDSNSNYHFRVYAPSNTDRMYNVNYGYFVIGTSHNDYRENCGDGWFGESEVAEGVVASAYSSRGFSVSRGALGLHNYEAYAREGSAIWYSDGWATLVRIP
jgi:hypothetical protein